MKGALVAIALLIAQGCAAQVAPAPAGPPSESDALVAAGRLQEAAWAARAAGDTAVAEVLLLRLDSILRSTPLHASPLGLESQGVSYTFRLSHGGGVAAIFKVDGSDIFCPSCGATREVAVYRIDRLLGFDLTPVTVLRTIDDDGSKLHGSSMYYVNGASRPSDVGAEKPDRLRLFDAIIGNSDRHSGNWLVRENGDVVAIDHNRAFEYRPASRPKTCWESQIDSLAAPGDPGPAFERYRTLPPDSLAAAVADVLEPALVAEFVAMRVRVVDRVRRRALNPTRQLPLEVCTWNH